jgi:NADH dehydrogenase
VLLVEAGPRLLAAFPPALADKAQAAIEQLGVTVLAGKPVTAITDRYVDITGIRVASDTVIWAAGVEASPAAYWLDAPADRAGRLVVGPDLTVPGYPEISAIGDTAACTDAAGRTLPGVAPVAKQQGRHVARCIASGRARAFRYRDYGNLATIGRHRAVIHVGRLQLSGTLAWLIWCTAHVFFLAGFRNRLIVGANWLWNYFTFDRSARLITGDHTPTKGYGTWPA